MTEHALKTPTGDFHGAQVDFQKEYHEARKLMGTRGTDLEELYRSVGLLYLNCPEWLESAYQALLGEILMRRAIMEAGTLPVEEVEND